LTLTIHLLLHPCVTMELGQSSRSPQPIQQQKVGAT